MILRRFMQHLKEQNWFAVGLDVLVVIVGIFLGLQVQEWNEERENRILEQDHLNNLHEEVVEGIKVFRVDFITNQIAEENLDLVLRVFAGHDPIDNLTNKHCFAVFASHIYIDRAISLPTLTELLASGQLSIIQNKEIKKSLAKYLISRDSFNGLTEHLSSVSLVLSRKYPELIKLDLDMRDVEDYDKLGHRCDFVSMMNNPVFQNDLVDNTAKLIDFVETSGEQFELLEIIHQELDKELEITH